MVKRYGEDDMAGAAAESSAAPSAIGVAASTEEEYQ